MSDLLTLIETNAPSIWTTLLSSLFAFLIARYTVKNQLKIINRRSIGLSATVYKQEISNVLIVRIVNLSEKPLRLERVRVYIKIGKKFIDTFAVYSFETIRTTALERHESHDYTFYEFEREKNEHLHFFNEELKEFPVLKIKVFTPDGKYFTSKKFVQNLPQQRLNIVKSFWQI